MRRFLAIALVGVALDLPAAADDPPAPRPWESSAFNVESGILWEIGTGTPIAYRLVPTQFSWRSPQFIGHVFADGSRLMIRHRVTLMADWIEHGPESHYIGVSGSPSIEWWDRSGTWSLYTGSGGGCGVIDSQGVKGGQGQDFTLNWFIRGGLEVVAGRNSRLTAGVMYQHMSNGGQTKPNPGIDAFGPMVGYSWSF